MGNWFGSLDLAYKYAIVLGTLFTLVIIAGLCKVFHDKRRIKKFVNNANLEAASAQEERVELNKREPDEGDLFGVRAIQSGFFGGVAQSRPSSVAGSVSPEGSSSNTLLGSHASSKLAPQSPMSSTTTLPLDARRSSPLAHKAMSSEDLNAPSTPKRRMPTPLRSTLAPSDAELSGRLTHDPAVNMFLEIPPSPVANSRPSTVFTDTHDQDRPQDQYQPPRPINLNMVITHNQRRLLAERRIFTHKMVRDRLQLVNKASLLSLGRQPMTKDEVHTALKRDHDPMAGRICPDQDEIIRQGRVIAKPNPGSPWVPKLFSGQATQALIGTAGSHWNTKEFGDLYDSYWRQGAQGPGNSRQGSQAARPADMARDGRRPAQMERKPQTISEVPSFLHSPSIGKAM
ncbi:MAG: hypothetical protein Q9208_003072 [Pyrenodesmia sp. 3 TL-2023]